MPAHGSYLSVSLQNDSRVWQYSLSCDDMDMMDILIEGHFILSSPINKQYCIISPVFRINKVNGEACPVEDVFVNALCIGDDKTGGYIPQVNYFMINKYYSIEGTFVASIPSSQRLFQASNINQVHCRSSSGGGLNDNCTSNESKLAINPFDYALSSSCLRGYVTLRSDGVHLVNKFAVLVTIQEHATNMQRHLVLDQDALQLAPYIHVGTQIVVRKAKKFRWMHAERSECLQEQWLLVSKSDACIIQPDAVVPLSIAKSLQNRTSEINLSGCILCFCSGWMLLQLDDSQELCKVYFQHCHKYALHPSFYSIHKDTVVFFTTLQPIYLYNKLQGYAYTIRSNLHIIAFSPPTTKRRTADQIYARLCSLPIGMHLVSHCYAVWRSLVLDRLECLLRGQQIASSQQQDRLLQHLQTVYNTSAGIQESNNPIKPLERVVQKEFVDSWYVDMHIVRASCDADYLARYLPKVCLVQHLIAQAKLVSKMRTYAIHLHMHATSSDYPRMLLGICSSMCSSCIVLKGHSKQTLNVYIRYAAPSSSAAQPSSIGRYLHASEIKALYALENALNNTSSSNQSSSEHLLLCIQRPLLLVEEQPMLAPMATDKNREDFKACVVADLQDISLMHYKDNRYSFYPISATSLPPLPAVNVCSIRDIMQRDAKANGTIDTLCIHSVVISKRIMVEDHDQHHQQYRKRKRDDESSVAATICLMLRDVLHADTLPFYINSSEVENVHIGMLIGLKKAVLYIGQTNKKMYMKGNNYTHVGKRSPSTLMRCLALTHQLMLDILGIVDNDELLHLSMQSQSSASYFNILPHSPTPPPCISLRSLHARKGWDRCLYRVQGSLSFIRKLTISLRCQQCFKQAITSRQAGSIRSVFVCPQCSSRANIAPHIDCLLAFDDHTAEGSVYVEGDTVYDVLYSVYDRDRKGLRQLRTALEAAVWSAGRYCYDHIDAIKQRVQTSQQHLDDHLDAMENILAGTAINANSNSNSDVTAFSQLVAGKYSQLPNEATAAYLSQFQYSRLFELWVKVDSYRSQFSITAEKKSRMLKIQESNRHRGYAVQYSQRATQSKSKLDLVVCKAVEVQKQLLTTSCYEMLACLA